MNGAPFSRDQPVPLAEDAFGHGDYASTLVSIVTDEEPPSTVGIFGSWGVGKSTILGGVRDRLAKTETAYAYFDAWRYEDDSLRRQFLVDVAKQLEAAGRLGGFTVSKDLRDLELETQGVEEALRFSGRRLLRAAIVGILFAFLAGAMAKLGLFRDVLAGKFGTEVLVSVAAFVVGTLAGLLSQTVTVAPTTVTRRTLQDPDRFASKFAELLGALAAPRLVVAVDNLDRCAPEKAIEMLSTIKTYLEPAGAEPPSGQEQSPGRVVFLVSLDDEALRRHLLAREIERSRHGDELAARLYVDDYLAKFFNTRLSVRPLLEDDMRGYIRRSLQPLVEARSIKDGEASRLVSLVSAGLRRNPRQVTQFVNDLESRIRLLEERERTEGGHQPSISPPVSHEVAMIAKLALLEALWPPAFERLQVDFRLLARWEAEAETAEEVSWAPPAEWFDHQGTDGELARRSRREFAAFLAQGRSIQSNRLPALLSLKQSPEEIRLPGLSDFRDAVLNSDVARAQDLLDAARSDVRAGLAKQLPALLEDEIRRDYVTGARAVVNAAVRLERLRGAERVRAEVLTIAVRHPSVRDQLRFVDPASLRAGAKGLAPEQLGPLLVPLVDRMLDGEEEDGERQAAADAIAPLGYHLFAEERERIVGALGSELEEKPEIWARLIEALPDLLPSGGARSALERLGSLDGSSFVSGRGEAALRVARVALDRERSADLDEPLVAALIAMLERAAGDTPALIFVLAYGEAMARSRQPLDGEQAARLVTFIRESWSQLVAVPLPTLLAFADAILASVPAGGRRSAAVEIVAPLFLDPTQGIQASQQLEQMPPSFREPWIAALEQQVMSSDKLRTLAMQQLRRLSDEEPSAFLDKALDEFLTLLSAQSFFVLGVVSQLTFVCENASALSDAQQGALVTLFTTWLPQHPDRVARLAAAAQEATDLAPGHRDNLVRALLAAERTLAAEEDRRALLVASIALAGAAENGATETLRGRFTQLQRGSEFDRSLVETFRHRIAPPE